MFINGEWCEASTGNSFEVVDPATGAVIGSMPDGTTADAERAIGAADAAFAEWSATTARERSDMLLRAWQIMTERAGELAELMTREQGKPLKAARNEVNYAADFLRYYSEEATRVAGEWLPSQRADQRFLI
ncbi:MAG: aldehyde dehydrogenase family protein, partial [Actinomycetota bacterium]|nr:aldehyde dehydrogenase family protein [Actinomycetota bacterium]